MFQQPFDIPLKSDSMSTLNASKLMVMEVEGINIRKRLKADAAKQIPTLNRKERQFGTNVESTRIRSVHTN